MKKENAIESTKKRKNRDPLDEMMDDMIRWEYKYRLSQRPLVEILREKYIITRKPNRANERGKQAVVR